MAAWLVSPSRRRDVAGAGTDLWCSSVLLHWYSELGAKWGRDALAAPDPKVIECFLYEQREVS
jgi:hypothetical protein